MRGLEAAWKTPPAPALGLARARAARLSIGEQGARRHAREIEPVRKPFRRARRFSVQRHFFVAGESQRGGDARDQARLVLRPHAERIAGRENKRFGRLQFDMPCLARFVGGGQQDGFDRRRRRRIFARKDIRRGRGGDRQGGGRDAVDAAVGGDFGGDLLPPFLRRRIEIDIAIDARRETRSAEFFELRVQIDSGAAKMFVTRIAEREHREFGLIEFGRALAEREIEKAARRLRRISLAVRADNREQNPLARQLRGLVFRHRQNPRRQARFGPFGRGFFGQGARVAGFGAVQNRRSRLLPGGGARGRRALAQTGEVARKPRQLRIVQIARDRDRRSQFVVA